ncbi:hypothetical protein [Caulobacter sp. 17J80-11]|uniref:hypothetical protein n=1 Tax=Caulobacter sp. 17J80-11 TaxID=2763502 RepID=UPI0016535099|nr:hypothetical protein [Caulobacter sp. 17J80-11]MBC6983333.1 hypothetical protein [Caulobacter sp. 17J80-11]
MAKFMAVFTGKPGAGRPDLDDSTIAKGIQAWGAWMAQNADRIVETGGPLGKTKKVSSAGIADIQNNLTGFVVLEADDHEAAARLFEGHPHFTIFPGDGVEVMPVLPIPGR